MFNRNHIRKGLTDVFYSFPVQLLVLHLKTNLFLTILWSFLALLLTGVIGKSFGIRFLFLDPEYFGKVDFRSFFIMGFAFGAFLMSWNLTTYLLSAHRFPFLASLARPFTKFCLNNGLIPLAFFALYLAYALHFQRYYEYWDLGTILVNLISLTGGVVLAMASYALYFTFTNKDISSYTSKGPDEERPGMGITPGYKGSDVDRIKLDKYRWRVDTYLNESFRPRVVRSVAHYDSRLLLRIFRQNHFNALVVQFATILLLVLIGLLMDYRLFRIPAGASIFIFASILTAIAGGISYWLHKWRLTVLIILVLLLNYFTQRPELNRQNHAFGLNYETAPARYSREHLLEMSSPGQQARDKQVVLQALENWRSKFGDEDPRMFLLNVSGGGLKATAWTMQVVRTLDSLSGGRLFPQVALITGASGGMIGAAYYRDLYWLQQQGDSLDLFDPVHIDEASSDLLNSVAFALVSNDLFIPWSRFEYQGQRYQKDRGYMFEKQLNENTGGVFDKPLNAYFEPEQAGILPMLMVTPAIINDARRLLISPQPASFLTAPPVPLGPSRVHDVDVVDFGYLFRDQGAGQLRFSTALRMNATYPWILPNVTLPSQPSVEIMDAGFRDNMGILTASRFVHVFKDWILENTSGVVMVQITSNKDTERFQSIDDQGMIESLFNPLSILGHLVRLQDFEHEASLGFLADILGPDHFDVVTFIYRPGEENERASMTFHLTRREKDDILQAIRLPGNQENIRRLLEAID